MIDMTLTQWEELSPLLQKSLIEQRHKALGERPKGRRVLFFPMDCFCSLFPSYQKFFWCHWNTQLKLQEIIHREISLIDPSAKMSDIRMSYPLFGMWYDFMTEGALSKAFKRFPKARLVQKLYPWERNHSNYNLT